MKSVDDIWDAAAALHATGPETVVVSSSELCDENSLLCLGSTVIGKHIAIVYYEATVLLPVFLIISFPDGKREKALLMCPKLEDSYTGTGDLFSALFLAWMWRSKNNMKQSLEYTVATIQAVLRRTTAFRKGIT